jgi:hypothetical protein
MFTTYRSEGIKVREDKELIFISKTGKLRWEELLSTGWATRKERKKGGRERKREERKWGERERGREGKEGGGRV